MKTVTLETQKKEFVKSAHGDSIREKMDIVHRLVICVKDGMT